MFQHILIATDGSKLAAKAVKCGVALAKSVGAKVTTFYAGPEYSTPVYAEGAMYGGTLSRAEFRKRQQAFADELLAGAAKVATGAGVDAQTVYVENNSPYEAIIAAANKRKCDLIVMASHGRKGLAGVLLGSETQKVLTHSKVPVLVVR